MVIYLGQWLPIGSSDYREMGRAALDSLNLAPSGVYMDASRYRDAGKLLPHLFTLAESSAVVFCCTFLEVTFTGR